ncbi:MAG: flagellar filament capping protein FliD [Acidobacteriota bacterium]
MGGISSILGGAGGLDVYGLVQQIMYVEREPIRRLDQKINTYQAKIEAFNKLNSELSSLASALDGLNDPESFSAMKAISSDEAKLTATASSESQPGTYQLQITRLALFDNFASASSFASSSSAIGVGSFDLTVGDVTTTITIDSSNNTLEGLKRAINTSGAQATAAIVNDGTGYRLTITSSESGAANALSISNNTLTLSDGLTPFSLSRTHLIGSTSELDALLTVNGLTVTSSSNQVQDVIEGVQIDLHDTTTGPVILTVENDADRVRESITQFVEAYNKAYTLINGQFEYNEAAKAAGPLAGESLLRSIQIQMSRIVSGAVSGLSGDLTNLAAAGIKLENDGTLTIDSATLDENLDERFGEIRQLFLANGETSHAMVSFLGLTGDTEAGNYQVNITTAPEAARISSPNAIGPTLGVDETLTFTRGASSSVVHLTSDMDLDAVVEALNDQLAADGLALSASKASNNLVITSVEKGSAAAFSVTSSLDGAGTGIGTAGLSDSGLDIAGSFTDTVTSISYAATGTGDVLTGDQGPVKGLRVQFTGAGTGTFGSVDVTLGYTEQLARLVDGFTDSLEGPINGTITNLEGTIRSFRHDIDEIENRLSLREQYLTEQFSRASQALQELNSLQASLALQLSQLTAFRS